MIHLARSFCDDILSNKSISFYFVDATKCMCLIYIELENMEKPSILR